MTTRILLVDDFDPWRCHVKSTLEHDAQWAIVGEASNGTEAVEKARFLRPDLILLDIGLPGLNGLEAARQILANTPNASILFVSEHRSAEIARAALDAGARGFVLKSDGKQTFLAALDAVVHGQLFISANLRFLLEAPLPKSSA